MPRRQWNALQIVWKKRQNRHRFVILIDTHTHFENIVIKVTYFETRVAKACHAGYYRVIVFKPRCRSGAESTPSQLEKATESTPLCNNDTL